MKIGLIIDAILILIVIINIINGRIRGMVKVLRGFLVPILAILLAVSLNGPATETVREMEFFDKIETKVSELVAEKVPSFSTSADTSSLTPQERAELEALLGQFDMTEEEKNSILGGNSAQTTKDALQELINNAIARGIAYLGVFLLAVLVLSILFAILGAIFKNALLRHADHVLGTVVGGLRGVLLVCVIVFVVDKASALIFTIFPTMQTYLEASRLFGWVSRFLNFIL